MKPCLLLAILATACTAHEAAPSDRDPTEATRTVVPEAPPPPPEFVAVVSTKLSKVITTDFDGRIEKLLVHSDQYVHAGDQIAQLDVHELRAKLDEAKARRGAAQAQAARAGALAYSAMRKARTEERLVRVGASAPEAFRSAESDANAASAEGGVAEGQIHEAAATIEELERLIATADVKAPIDGVVSVVKAKEGEIARKGTALVRVFDTHDLVIKFAVPRDQRTLVRLGQAVELAFEGDRRAAAVVRQIDDDHDPAIDFLQVTADLDPTRARSDDLRVGVTGHVLIAKGAKQ